MTFSKLAKEVLVEVIQNKSITEKGVADIAKKERDNWMTPIREYLRLGALLDDPQKGRKLRIKASLYKMIEEKLFGRPQVIISDNGKQFVEGTFPVFCKKLGTLQASTSVCHPQENGQSSNGETPFSLVYGSEAVIPIEISMETKRVQDFDPKENKKRRREDLGILEEMREMASIKEAHYKQKLEGYYNKNVKPSTFKPGTYVLGLNSFSKAEYQRKMGPTWEGPYVIRKAYGDGADKLETLSGEVVDRT
ncbi:reverse transcriptase domain-containing protein [Tanacetum coccineum]